jgi:hypothetical protein
VDDPQFSSEVPQSSWRQSNERACQWQQHEHQACEDPQAGGSGQSRAPGPAFQVLEIKGDEIWITPEIHVQMGNGYARIEVEGV